MTPVTVHGRDHRVDGADPIPGIGSGGGALEWEDVGGVTPAFQAETCDLQAAAMSVPASSDALLSWTITSGGGVSAIVDVTTPTTPKVLKGGIYAITATVNAVPTFPAGASAGVSLTAGGRQVIVTGVQGNPAVGGNPWMLVALTTYIAVNTTFSARASNSHTSAHQFQAFLRIVRVAVGS